MQLPRYAALLVACAVVTTAASSTAARPTFSTKVLIDATTAPPSCALLQPTARTQRHRAIATPTDVLEQRVVRQNRVSIDEIERLQAQPRTAQTIVEVIGGSTDAVNARAAELCPHTIAELTVSGVDAASTAVTVRPASDATQRLLRRASTQATAQPVVQQIVDSGNPSNRIDVVFMGDGYTASEQTKFFGDIQRLTNDMFTGDTFAQYLPLFNIWAAFVPSVESGIGVGGTPKNTAFGLYRDGTELRGVYVSDPERARTVCASVGTDACDFPSLIGNDNFYGGLGGEFVITTRSPTSGTMALRHELGHNFGKVGEEYDGGQVYYGANSVKSLANATWKHWLTEPTKLVEQKAAQLYQKHIWHDLAQGAYTITFTSTGAYKRWYILLTASGVDTNDSLTVTLDGEPLPWTSNGRKDRSFYSWRNRTSGFAAGTHILVVKGGGSFTGPIATQLCHVDVFEYKDESECKLDDPNYIGLYPTYDVNKVKSYRPSGDKCLMRNMTSTSFCSVCIENMWLKFMARIEFIDDVVVSGKSVEVKLIPLGQLRLASDGFRTTNPALAVAEKYTIQWLKNGAEVAKFRDQTKVDLTGEESGEWTVRVTFSTPSVRADPNKYMVSEKTFVPGRAQSGNASGTRSAMVSSVVLALASVVATLNAIQV